MGQTGDERQGLAQSGLLWLECPPTVGVADSYAARPRQETLAVPPNERLLSGMASHRLNDVKWRKAVVDG